MMEFKDLRVRTDQVSERALGSERRFEIPSAGALMRRLRVAGMSGSADQYAVLKEFALHIGSRKADCSEIARSWNDVMILDMLVYDRPKQLLERLDGKFGAIVETMLQNTILANAVKAKRAEFSENFPSLRV